MSFRNDIFRKIDMVEWDSVLGSAEMRAKYGDGPFMIVKIEDPPYSRYEYDVEPGECQSNWESMGHTQFLTVETDKGQKVFSGAYFRRIGWKAESQFLLKSDETSMLREAMLAESIACHYCERDTNKEVKSLFPIVEHFIPRSREKEFGAQKLVLACAWCDKRKGPMWGQDYLNIVREETLEKERTFAFAMADIKKRCKAITDDMSRAKNLADQGERGCYVGYDFTAGDED